MALDLETYKITNVIQGDYAVSEDPEVMMTTILGSCVSVCLFDSVRKIGGMNHFLLPGYCDSSSGTMSCGLNMMELLINALQRKGAARNRLQAKLFGGSNMNEGLTDIGMQNADFARDFLRHEGIPMIGESLGGNFARRIRYWPVTGKARQMEVTAYEKIPVVQAVEKPGVTSSDVEFF